MLLTLASIMEAQRQELGRSPTSRAGTPEALANEAGEAWVNLYRWGYLRDRTLEIALERDTEDYRLPAGIRSVSPKLHRSKSIWPAIELVDFATYTARRERLLSEVDYQLTPFAATHYDTREGDKRPRLYLSVYPPTLTETVVVTAQAGWLPLDDLDSQADIPPQLGQPFLEWARRYAMGRDKPEVSGGVDAVTQAFLRGPQGVIAKTVDADARGPIVKRTGGAGERYRRRGVMGAKARADQLDILRGGSNP